MWRQWMLVGALVLGKAAFAADAWTPADFEVARGLVQRAQSDTLAYELVESLTTEVGPRPAGSENDPRAVAWAVARLRKLGFDRVYTEPVKITAWKRGAGHAELTAPYPQPLAMTALGNSVPTPPQGIVGEIAYYPNFDSLKTDQSDRAKGKIVFIDQRTERLRDGSGYGRAVAARSRGAVEAGKRGALALVIRSIGTDHDRLPHTGGMSYDNKFPKIPAAAVSVPDADLITRIVKRGAPVKMHLTLGAETDRPAQSENVIAEVRGSEKPEEVVLLGAHLDSWDLGTGALDDGAGVGIVTAAAKLIQSLPAKPRRTIRVVLFANEENGLSGAAAYAEAHGKERHQLAVESDHGAGLIYRLQTRVRPEQRPLFEQIAPIFATIGISLGNNEGGPAPDVALLHRQLGMPAAALDQDGSDYFDYHHTANDTLDKVDPAKLPQQVAAYAALAWLMAQSAESLEPVGK